MKGPNPKDLVGRTKLPLHLWPPSATAMGCLGLLEGNEKYGRTNWRATPVLASVYVAAAMRHLDDWREGNDNATDSGNPHLGNALACIAIIVDAAAHGTLIDDRNFQPGSGDGYQRLVATLTPQVGALMTKFGGVKPKHYDRRDQAKPRGKA